MRARSILNSWNHILTCNILALGEKTNRPVARECAKWWGTNSGILALATWRGRNR